jgi:lysophospholipase L1-like esterase
MNPIPKILFALAGSCLCLHAQPPAADKAAPPAATPRKVFHWDQPPDQPLPKPAQDGTVDRGFQIRHEQFLSIAKKNDTGVVFLGDSITEFWTTAKGRAIWDKNFGQFRPANFGISGDRTQHVLWRVNNGEFDNFQPKAVVLLVGINNICGPSFLTTMGGDSVEGISTGIAKIVETIRQKTPATKILICGLFPREWKGYPVRAKIKELNASIAQLADDKSVFFIDFSDKFLTPEGEVSRVTLPDTVHPSTEGYQIMADAITPKLTALMK